MVVPSPVLLGNTEHNLAPAAAKGIKIYFCKKYRNNKNEKQIIFIFPKL